MTIDQMLALLNSDTQNTLANALDNGWRTGIANYNEALETLADEGLQFTIQGVAYLNIFFEGDSETFTIDGSHNSDQLAAKAIAAARDLVEAAR